MVFRRKSTAYAGKTSSLCPLLHDTFLFPLFVAFIQTCHALKRMENFFLSMLTFQVGFSPKLSLCLALQFCPSSPGGRDSENWPATEALRLSHALLNWLTLSLPSNLKKFFWGAPTSCLCLNLATQLHSWRKSQKLVQSFLCFLK